MQKIYSLIFSSLLIIGVFALVNGCQKDAVAPTIEPSKSMTEEFDTVANLYSRGWIFNNNSRPQGAASWQQGIYTIVTTKTGAAYSGFPAYSYKSSADEYVFAGYASGNPGSTISSWMITPSLDIKNGDKISFYTRTFTGSTFADRLQIRLNPKDNSADVGFDENSIGKFTTLLGEINPALVPNGYPQTWTKYEFTITGLVAPLQRRIAFRYYVPGGGLGGPNSNAIGIDQFQFTSL